jgi:hypothetical protein
VNSREVARKGGLARADSLSAAERSAAARKAANARWAEPRGPKRPREGGYTIKVPTEAYESAKAVRALIIRRGLDAIPAGIVAACPLEPNGDPLAFGYIVELGLAALAATLRTEAPR